MSDNNDAKIAEQINAEGRFESDAHKAKQLLIEYSGVIAKMQELIKSTGNQPQDPVNFCRTIILAYGMKKLESKIITP